MPELKSFDRVAHLYDDTRGFPPQVDGEIAAGLARIMRDVRPEPRALEVGIGTGRMALPLAEEGVRVAGIDISPKMLAVLRAKAHAASARIDVMLAEASSPPLRPESFDALLFVHVLHLVPDAEATLLATLPLARHGGIVIFGGDEGHIGRRAEAERLIRLAALDVAGIELAEWEHRDRPMELCARVLRARTRDARTATLASWTSVSTGRGLLDRLRRQDYSTSWKIPDAALPAVIERVTPQLEALYGGLDREHRFERTFTVTYGRMPE